MFMPEVKHSNGDERMIGYVKAEFLKMKHTGFYELHLFLPIVAAGVFLAYNAVTDYNIDTQVTAYIQILGIAFPFLISLVCSISMDTEEQAAHYYHMFGSQRKSGTCFFAKFCMLALMGLFAEIIAVLLFYVGLFFISETTSFSLQIMIQVVFIQYFSILILYSFHLVLELYFGKGVSLITGGLESLIAALFFTALGDHLWRYLPCSYGVRFPSYYLMEYWGEDVTVGIAFYVIYLILGGMMGYFAINRYER